MNTRSMTLKLSLLPLAAVAALGIPATLHAQTSGVWNLAGGGAWGTAANWTGGVPAGAGASADFTTRDITAARTITLDANRTIGSLLVGDATTVNNDTTINAGSTAASVLTLDVTSGTGVIGVQNRNLTINTPIAGNDGLTVTNAGAGVAPVTALGNGGGVLILAGSNTFTGGLNIRGASVQLSNNNAANSGGNVNSITLGTAVAGTGASRLLIAGGITNASPITIDATTGIVGAGVLQQTGTGAGTLNGPINIIGSPSGGGHFVGGAATNPLVLNGFIDSALGLSQREGFVRYGGGGNYPSLTATNTIVVNAADGLSTVANIILGGSGNATLDLNGFDQTLGGVTLGNSTNAFTGTVNLGSRTLTLNGDITTVAMGAGPVTHVINGSGGGNINGGASARFINVNENPAVDELYINGAVLSGAGGFVKAGPGILAVNSTVSSLSVDSGTLSIGRTGLPGTFTASALTFQDFAALNVDLGPGGDTANAGTLTTNGITTLNLHQMGGLLAPGTYPILNYTGTSPGLSGFSLPQPPGHSTASLIDTGSAIALLVTDNKRLIWNGALSNEWDVDGSTNWFTLAGVVETPARYLENDDILFPTTTVSSTVNLNLPVKPSLVTFDNASPVNYDITGSGSIGGGASLVKNGTGRALLAINNTYVGATTVNNGTLELDHDATGNVVLANSSEVTVAPVATLELTRDDGPFTFSRNISGTGTVLVNPHSIINGSAAHGVALTGNNTNFSGSLQLLTPLSGTYRLTSITPAQLGSSTITVNDGAQVFTANGQTYNNPITLTGKGFQDTGGFIGALRLEANSNWAGPVTISGAGARIGVHNTTATISGNITGGDLNAGGSDGTFNNNYTLILTGTNSYGKTTIGGGSSANGVSTRRINIGNGGTTGTLGSGPVEIFGDPQNGLISFDRSNGYTLAAGQTISMEPTSPNPTRVFLEVDTLGTGFNQNGQAISFGAATPAQGGNIRVGQARAGAIFNTDGAITTETIRVASGQTGAVMNINSGTVINSNTLFAGEAANMSGTINQAAGSTVNITGQVRAGHFGTNTSVYNMNGGTLTLTGASPVNTPSTAGGGDTATAGDNNIELTIPTTVVGGGIYLGIDGTGIFNHNGGTVTTNWIVLDNRGNTGSGTNMPTGIDEYNLNNGTLNLRSGWGIIQRNLTAGVNLAGGTIRIDNTGTGNLTGADLTVPLDANLNVTGPVILDTNGATNSFAIPRSITGTGTLNLNGSGTLRLNPATGIQAISATLTGPFPLVKENAGTTLITGPMTGYNGNVTVNNGRLDLPAAATPATVTVGLGAAVGGEYTTPSLSLDNATVHFDPTTPGALTGTALTVNGTITLDFTRAVADGTYVALKYSSKTGGGTFVVNNSTSYRSLTVTEVAGEVRVTVANTKTLIWDGTGATTWNTIDSTNWKDAGNVSDQFFFGDGVLFNDLSSQTTVTVSPGVSPAITRVNAVGNNYTFNSTGLGISGGGGLIKEGASTLTLNGPNTYSGVTDIRGGALFFTAATSLGNAAPGNSIALSGASRIIYGGATALDLGLYRDIAVGTGGGSLTHSNATAATLTIPGRLIGSEPLTFNSTAAGGGTFVLAGDNSGYTGAISAGASAAGLTTLRLSTPTSVPGGGSITLNFPAAGATGNATGLDLGNVTVPAGVAINLTSGTNGTISLRSQITNTANANAIVEGPINLSGNNIIQLSIPSGSLTLNGPVAAPNGFTGTLFLRGAGGIGTINDNITLPNGILSKTDANTWVINTTGNTWATTNIVVGGIRLGIADALCTTAPLSLGQNDGNAVTLNLNGFNQTVASLATNPIALNANTTGKVITSPAATPATLTVNQVTTTTYAGTFTGSASLVKAGSGSLTLRGASANTGTTTVSEGSLILNNTSGSATGTGAVSVAANATLGGNGSFTGPLTVDNGAVLSPGLPTGTLTTGPATISGGSTYDWEISDWTGAAGTGYDKINATSLALTATPATPLLIRIASPGGPLNFADANASFTILSTTGGITGFDPTAVQLDVSGFTGGGAGTFSVAQSGNDLILNYTVPGGSTPYDIWATSEGLSGPDTALTSDPDRDGANNLAEFALNSKPRAGADSGKTRFALANISGQTYLTYTLPVRTGIAFTGTTELSGTGDAIRYRIQSDTGLSTWLGDVEEVTPALSASLPALDSGWTYRTFRTAAPVTSGTRQFIRAKLESAP